MKKRNDYMTVFVSRLMELKEGRSASELAREVGIPQRTVSGWITKKATPRMDYVISLAIYFKVSTDYLLGLEDELGNKTYNG